MKIIKSQLRSRIDYNWLNKLGILSMQKTLVNEKVKAGNSTFHEKVVQHFIKQNIEILFFSTNAKVLNHDFLD